MEKGIKRQLTILQQLNYDSLLYIFSFLTPKELCQLCLVSKDFKVLVEDEWLWKLSFKNIDYLFELYFGIKYPGVVQNDHFQQQCITTSKKLYTYEYCKIEKAKKFVGLWSEKWCDVDVPCGTKIIYDGHTFSIQYTKNKFSSQFFKYDDATDTLEFFLTGGDSGWSFLYSLKPIQDHLGVLHLTVQRIHDNTIFQGIFVQGPPDSRFVNNNSNNISSVGQENLTFDTNLDTNLLQYYQNHIHTSRRNKLTRYVPPLQN
ncbi:hypothetical protein CYY_008976 [Polysphondylium violaceum]|uniref:F-box domain-containing protein n=1 Tax=Polysphondylium violaceum TaxID=133409 RepID=A0A8J4PPM8_9MYCE|nr:hypothetical protein CYY_008976 [Polysphondylium violaceum]